MKYAIIIPDGCADWPIDSLGGRTPMQAARTPHLDALARSGIVGRNQNVPEGFSPGSDVATLGLLGFSPAKYYTGRAPLEAAAQGIELGPDDWAVRCNLVTIENKTMKSFTAGHITSEDAAALLETLNERATPESLPPKRYYPGVSYRNLLVVRDRDLFSGATKTAAPHDYTDKPIEAALPEGPGAERLRRWMDESRDLFADHPVNRARMAAGKLPATQTWLWGLGQKPKLPSFNERFAPLLGGRELRGAMITAVDLLRGIASLIGWDNIDVPGITGYVDTDYAAKGRYAAEALQDYDIVCVHVEATDEAGHEGSVEKKVKAMEEIDAKVVPPILEALKASPDGWRLFVSPDHPTPIATKTHTSEFVPWLLAGSDVAAPAMPPSAYDEENAKDSPHRYDNGWEMLDLLFRENI